MKENKHYLREAVKRSVAENIWDFFEGHTSMDAGLCESDFEYIQQYVRQIASKISPNGINGRGSFANHLQDVKDKRQGQSPGPEGGK